MDPDDHVCLCFRVSQRKLVTYLRRERPRVASQLSECLGAGTGCQWCVPYLCRLFEQWEAGEEPVLGESSDTYAQQRADYRASGRKRRLDGIPIAPPEEAAPTDSPTLPTRDEDPPA